MPEVKESFEEMFELSMLEMPFKAGALINATIVDIKEDRITLNAGLKSDAVLPINEFRGDEIKLGDITEVVIEHIENGFGETRLSREKAKRTKAWNELDEKFNNQETIIGTLTERVKGGFTVLVGSYIRAFLPGSLVDVKPVRDSSYLEGKDLEFKIVKMDERRNNIVVSRRAVIESESSADRQALMKELQKGQEVVGIVKNITDYGAFVDLGGLDGLLHITDIAWRRVKHPSDVLTVGEEIRVKILSFDSDKNRVSLGIKQLGEDPWLAISGRYPEGARLKGCVTNITDYGCFVELEDGVEGLVHMSEMDWTNKNVHPSKVVKVGEKVEVEVLSIDEERRRISLGIKQCKSNPWDQFSEQHAKADIVVGKIRSITDFGVFIGLEGEIDGLVHLTDLSWTQAGEEAVLNYKKGDEVKAIILSIDSERERISLGVKQLENDPVTKFLETHKTDQLFAATVEEVDKKMAHLRLDTEDQVGVLRRENYSAQRIENLADELKVGDTMDVRVTGIDGKVHMLRLSCRQDGSYTDQASNNADDAAPQHQTLGDLFKNKSDNNDT
jgi:small subunit ribosomal protein S1